MIPLYFVAAACVSVVLNIWAESVDTGRPPKETARKLVEATSKWVATKSRATVDYVGRLQLGRRIHFPRVRSNLIAAVPHDFILVNYRNPPSLRRSSRDLSRSGVCTVDVLKPRTLQLPAVSSQLNSVVLYEPHPALVYNHPSLSASTRVCGDFNSGAFTLVLVAVIPLIAIVVVVVVVAFCRTRHVDETRYELPPPTRFIEDVRLILDFEDVTDILLQLDDSTLEFTLGDIEVKGIILDKLVPPLEEPDMAANDPSCVVSGPNDVAQDIVDDDPNPAPAIFDHEHPVASLIHCDDIECEVDTGAAVPAIIEHVPAATPDVSPPSAITEFSAALDAVNVPLPAVDSDEFIDHLVSAAHQDAPPDAAPREISTSHDPQVAVRPSQVTFANDFLGGMCQPSVLSRLIEIHVPAVQKRILEARQLLNHRDGPTPQYSIMVSAKGKEKEKAPEQAPEQRHVSSWTVNAFPKPGCDFIRGKKIHNRNITIPTFPSPPPPPPTLLPVSPDQHEPAVPHKKTRRGGEAYRRQQQRIKDAEDQLIAEAAEKARELARFASATIIGHANHRVSESIRLPDDPLDPDAPRLPHVVRLVDLVVSRRGSPLVAPEDLVPLPAWNRPFNIPPSPNYGARHTQPYDENDDRNYDDEFPPFPPDAPSGGAALSSAVASTPITPWSATGPLSESLAQVAPLWADVHSWDADPDTPTSSTPQASSSSSPAPTSGFAPPEAPSTSQIIRPSSSSRTPRQQQTSRTSSATHQQAVCQPQSPSLPPSTSHTGRAQHTPSSSAGPSRSRGFHSLPSATLHAPTPGPSSSSQIPRPDPTSTSSTATQPDSSSRQRSRGQPSGASQPPRSAPSSSTANATTQNASRTTTGASMTTTRPQPSTSTCPSNTSTASTTTRHPSTSSAPRRRRPQEAHGASSTTTSTRLPSPT